MLRGLKGEYSHNIDAKGRLIIPAKFRDDLGEHFVITKGMENCLYVYPEAEWDKAKWEAKNAEVEMNIEDIASDMEASGFSI